MKKKLLLPVALLAFCLGACSTSVDNSGGSNPPVDPSGDPSGEPSGGGEEIEYILSIAIKSKTLNVGDTYQINYSVTPKSAKVVFSSSNSQVASVSSTGLVTALKRGSATITASIEGHEGVYKTIDFTIQGDKDPSDDYFLELDEYSTSLEVGDTYQINYSITPAGTRVAFTNNHPSIIRVSSTGLITALKAGEASVLVYVVDDDSFNELFQVVVKEKSEPVDPGDDPGDDPGTDPGDDPGDDPVNPPAPVEPEDKHSMQDIAILHCFDWSISNIISNLQNIKDAGYSAIQLSPMQPQKDPYKGNWRNEWWKLYQPLGFTVAGSGANILGSKSDLTSLCSQAEAKGIKVIVDVVSNHLADGGGAKLYSNVRNYEQEIYDKNLIHNLNKQTDDNDTESIVRGRLGDLPDLMTEDSRVQKRALSLLKEYIDCGVDGFRFDAAKHIETPSDGDYASDFWPYILDGATNYAEAKGLDEPYYYGEILSTPGTHRSFSYYTSMMSTLDSRQGSDVLSGVLSGSLAKINQSYNSGVDPSKLVLWGESHDTYSNGDGETKDVAADDVKAAYVIQTSRKDASTLFFARPNNNSNLGDVGLTNYKDAEVAAVNKFHTMFRNYSEDIVSNNGCFVNVRGSSGAVIVPIVNKSATSATVNLGSLKDGTYVDLITENEVSVSGGKASVNFTNRACVLVDKNFSGDTVSPSINVGYNEVYSGAQNISVSVKNATSVTYSINNGSSQTLSGNTIALPSSLSDGLVSVKITAKNSAETTNKTIRLVKTTNFVNKDVIIAGVDDDYTYLAWTWSNDKDSKWVNFEKEGTLLALDKGSASNFIIVKFTKGTTTSTADWGKKISQSDDLTFNTKVYYFSDFGL